MDQVLAEVSRHRAGRSAIGLTVALHMVACASSPEPAHNPTPILSVASSAPSGLSLLWRNTELRPIDQPIAIGAVVVGVVADDRKAFVVSIDPATGRKLWQQRLSHSRLPRGVRVRVTKVGDDKVAYLRLVSEDATYANLVVADARTGRELARSPNAWFASPPIVCANGKDVCAISVNGFERNRQYRLDLASGAYLPENDHLLRWTRFLDDVGLIDIGDRPGNTLGLLRNGAVQWLTRLSAGLPLDFSSDNGWSWRLYADQHVFVGGLYGDGSTTGPYYVSDLASSATVGLSEGTGEVLWRDLGSNLRCHVSSRHYHVRCRTRGKIWYHTDRDSPFVADLDVIVEGFDPVTGKTTWSVPMGATEALESPRTHPSIAGPSQVVLEGPHGPVVLDYATGTLGAPAPGATFWCIATARYELAPPYRVRTAVWKYTRTGGTHASICDGRGRPATALPSIAATMATGARVGNYAVIATRDGYLGFKAP